ncbi:MAG: enoyl-CoA hydratase/isomerase family protein, partial [Burkholderiales bacterium]
RDGLLAITLNRPQKANALSIEMTRGLAATLRNARGDEAVRGVLITGAGERVFSGGVDVRQISAMPPGEFQQARSTAFFAVLMELVDFEKPVVAAVNGVASGGGFMIAALTDVIIVSDTASFALPEIDLGTPALAGLAILEPLVVGALAYDLVQSGRHLSAAEAERHGLVRAAVPRADVLTEAEKAARHLMAKLPRAFAAGKAWMRKPVRAALESAERAMVTYRAAGGE